MHVLSDNENSYNLLTSVYPGVSLHSDLIFSVAKVSVRAGGNENIVDVG